MATDSHGTARLQRSHVLLCRHATNTINDDACRRRSQTQGGVAQQSILQLVGSIVVANTVAGCQQTVLGQAGSLANGITTPIVIASQHILREGKIHVAVIVGIDSTRRAIEGDGATRGVQHSRLADILLLSVEGHDVARCRQPQGQTHA